MEVIARLNSALAGRYSIEREAGAGGMATVYVARDLKHNRRVALKVLDPELGSALGADRFLSEIQVTAHLQHPNVLPLFDSGQAEQLLFYVMPFVEGESLRDRLNRERQLPIDDAVRIATAIAGALDYAHGQGVIHRDLKPENILLQAGQPVLADFGIALAVAKAGGTRVTQTGISLGTPQYMSPEQATGDRVIDGRSDIYSLGAVLYEMLTGDPPHTGSTTQAMIAKILTEPTRSVRIFRETVSEQVDAAVLQSLAKFPADRFSTGHEFAEALAGKRGAGRTAAVTMRRGARRTAVVIAPWLIAAVAVVVTVARRPASVASVSDAKFLDLVVPDSISDFAQPTLTDDGRLLAFVGKGPKGSGIFVRSMSGVSMTFLAGTSGALRLSFSKDDRWIAFYQGSRWHKVPVAGGPIVTVTDTIVLSAGRAVWTDEGDLIVGASNDLRRYTAGVSRPTSMVPEAVAKRYQRFDPGAMISGTDLLLVHAWGDDSYRDRDHGVAVVNLRSGAIDELGVLGGSPRFAEPNLLVYQREQTVFAAPLSPDRRRLIGPEVPVLDTVQSFAVSGEGTMVFVRGKAATQQMVFVDRRGRLTKAPVDSGRFDSPSVSPDGRVILFDGPRQLWAYDAARGSASRLPFVTANQPNAAWSTDGTRIFHTVDVVGGVAVKSRSWTDTDTGGVVMSDPRFDVGPVSVGPPGTFIAGWRSPRMGNAGGDLVYASMDSMNSFKPLTTSLATERQPRISRDGKLLAYTSDESGRNEVYVQALPPVARAIHVSVNGGSEPVWARNGHELFYRSVSHFMTASLQSAPTLRVIRRDTLFPDLFAFGFGRYSANYDVMPGDAQFVTFKANAAPPRRVFAIVNWTALAKSSDVSMRR